jgi:riboflavin kinase/FMN adenylyltransferase
MEAEPFVEELLRHTLLVEQVVVGYDFTFGRGRRGNTALLSALGARLGMGVTVIPAVQVDGLTCSSTKIREFLLEGRVEGAKLLLGRPFEITGRVEKGAGRGRVIGIPTANVRPEGELICKTGIYAARVRYLENAGRPGHEPPAGYVAAVSIGTNPTFQTGSPVTVEAHILDFDGDLYGARLRLEMETRLRDEVRFASVDELMVQIQRDIVATREIFS